ncbi:MAG: hypothetical protein JO027_02845 [Solirubrobacterales bacterium]|nr:hypothetical protein [Solirubrobacterales bacterium]
MTEQLESDLREALRARAAQVPAAAAARLSELDYRPRTRRIRPPVAIGAMASAAAAAGTLAMIISLGAGASSAFAGWTAKPTKAAPGQLAAASAACQRSQSSVAGLPLALADTRGPFTFAVYANRTSIASCMQGPSFVSLSESQSSSPVSVPADRVMLSSAHRSQRGGKAFGFAYGRTGAGVSAVALVLDDGTEVQATVDNGWFIGWWPSGAQLKAADLTTPTGSATQTFDLSSNAVIRSPQAPGGCNTNKDCPGGSASGSSAGAGSDTQGDMNTNGGGGSVGQLKGESQSSSQ